MPKPPLTPQSTHSFLRIPLPASRSHSRSPSNSHTPLPTPSVVLPSHATPPSEAHQPRPQGYQPNQEISFTDANAAAAAVDDEEYRSLRSFLAELDHFTRREFGVGSASAIAASPPYHLLSMPGDCERVGDSSSAPPVGVTAEISNSGPGYGGDGSAFLSPSRGCRRQSPRDDWNHAMSTPRWRRPGSDPAHDGEWDAPIRAMPALAGREVVVPGAFDYYSDHYLSSGASSRSSRGSGGERSVIIGGYDRQPHLGDYFECFHWASGGWEEGFEF